MQITGKTFNTAGACRYLTELMQAERPVSSVTLWRWRTHGMHFNGRTYKLEAVFLGGRVMYSEDAIREFITVMTAARSGQPVPEAVQPAGRGHEAASRILDAAGI